ncbi:MAG: MjaI family restriction endonuclease [Desulfobacterales bacterium]|uniref:MjaI family restriction endonuclease n=1 Tax=Candidatus Desulfaltia bathyphila TaxID=2841697 RepID=A0A8J6N7T1_9BACT|nr:MjaI family restriction endonuclease [Candidatus Desulfaltia bathyphila]MBL7207273.1 MjaI family restriction endonuclease [Desulfobacterales bacterium]
MLIYSQFREEILGCKIEAAPDEWDRTYGVDFYIKVNNNYIGIQIKPISSGQSINQYQWEEMHRKNHERFKNDFRGNVFFVYSVKGSGKKKKIYNTEVIDQIIEEIDRLS